MSSSDNLDKGPRTLPKLEPIIKGEKKTMSRREIDLDQAKILTHQQLFLEGVEIYFPFKPYQIQEDYMKSVVQALNTKCNALLQSPTGTGKTLSLLCAALGWLRNQRANPKDESVVNRILFCSRTHSQLKQVMKELKATAYKPKVCILASRDQYCLKKEYSNLKDLELNSQCKNAVKNRTCQYYNYNGDGKQQQKILDDVLDIEELQEKGRCKKFCPYYYSREIKDDADIVILPYSFLLQQCRFVEFQVILKDSIIIFDEAHNVPTAAEDGTSYKVDQNLVEESLNELDYLEKNLTPSMRTDRDDIKDARQLVNAIGNLIKYYEKEGKVEKLKDGSMGMVSPVSDLFEKIEQIGGQLMVNQRGGRGKKLLAYDKYKKTEQKPNGTSKQFFDYKDMLSDLKKQKEEKGRGVNSQQQPTLFNFNFKKVDQSQHPDIVINQTQNQMSNKKSFSADKMEYEEEEQQMNQSGYNKKSMELSMKRIVQVSKKLSLIITDMQTMRCQNIDFFAGFILGICDMYEQDQAFKKGQTSKKLSDYYKFYFNKSTTKQEQSSINLWCLDPSLAFQNILKEEPYSLILTSGTLHPMNSWDSELGVEFKVKTTTSHVINIQKSLVGGVVKVGPKGQPMNFSFSNRSNGIKVYEELGEFLVQLSKNVPNGILVCFSSGSLMRLAQEAWLESQLNIISRLNALKDVFFEPRTNIELQSTMKQYCNAAEKDDRGAIMFCVCRGKISEGIDFTDKLARSVVLVGVPFPPAADTWVITKQEYLDSKNQREKGDDETKLLTGKEWYFLCTVRALNQAIGRVIRHKDDFGSVYLCDNRFSQGQFYDQISGWVRPILKNYSSLDYLMHDCQKFFEGKKQAVTTLDDILKLGNNKKDSYESIKNIADREMNEGKMSYQNDDRMMNKENNSKRKVNGSFRSILEKEKRVQQSPSQANNTFIGNNNINIFPAPPQNTSANAFSNIFMENQKRLTSPMQGGSLNKGNGILPPNVNVSTKNIFQLIQEREQSNSNPFLYDQQDNRDKITKNISYTESLKTEEDDEEDIAYIQNLLQRNKKLTQFSRTPENMKMEEEIQNNNELNQSGDMSQFKQSFPNIRQTSSIEQNSQFSLNSKSNGMFDLIKQKRKIIINESQDSIQIPRSPMSVDKSYTNPVQQEQDQSKVLRLKSSSLSKEPSVTNLREKALSQQSVISLNKPFIMKGSRDDMMNLFRTCSDDESSNSFEIARPPTQNEKQLNIKQTVSNESSVNFLSDIFRKHQTQLTNEHYVARETSLDQKSIFNLSKNKSKDSLSPESLNKIDSLDKRQKSIKLTPTPKEDGNNQKSFKEILHSRNSFGSQRSISPISKYQNNNDNSAQQDEKALTQQVQSQQYASPINKIHSLTQQNQKIMLVNASRGLASFNGDIIKQQRKQSRDDQFLGTPNPKEPIERIQSESKDNLCPICYEIPKNNHISTKCQHYACYTCWQNWLAEQLTCPMCRIRCRLSYLEPSS